MGKGMKLAGGIFAVVGLLFAGFGFWFWWGDNQIARIGRDAHGEVIALETSVDSDGDTTYRPRVAFTDEAGQRHVFVGRIGSSPPSFVRGEAVDVIYDPANPERAIIDSFGQRHLFPLVFGGLGSLFAAVGIGILYAVIRRRRTIERLKHQGLPIHADFVDCYYDTSTKVNGRSPWRVTAQAIHPATGKMHVFKSEPIWANLDDMLQGKHLRVLVDPANPKLYYMDLSEYLDESALG